ncbi:putative zinc finger protein [Orchesella cincta]|uniref:Putative zinc finger protein n=1 Tax=Orchesella cincta TaxID=48709 RepID=A0A1D2MRM4_ORCCI|nr:putative zinc finger protein [Orchesella cincta]
MSQDIQHSEAVRFTSTDHTEQVSDDDDDDDEERRVTMMKILNQKTVVHRRLDHTETGPIQTTIPHQCETCLDSFPSETALEKHRVVAHNLPAYIRCPGCGMTFPTFVGLRKHRARRSKKNCYLKNAKALQPASSSVFPHHVIVKGRKFCPHENCNELFNFDSQLNIHLKTHGSWPCAHCGLMFEKAHDMAWHEVTQHNQRLTKPPPDPEDPNATQPTNTSESRISCPICQKALHTAATKKDLTKHMKAEHEWRDWIHPGFSSARSVPPILEHNTALQSHEGYSQNREKLPLFRVRQTAITCEKASPRCQNGLKGNHECPICKEMFELLPQFERHVKSHEYDGQDRAKGTFICEICSVVCTRRDTFRRHMKVKHGPPTHCCETCGKMFGNRDRLNQHIPSHNDGSNPLICHLCGASFAATLKVHLRKKHKAKPTPDIKLFLERCD